MGLVSKGLKNELETAKVNEPSVFEPLKLYCMCTYTEEKVLYSSMRGRNIQSLGNIHSPMWEVKQVCVNSGVCW